MGAIVAEGAIEAGSEIIGEGAAVGFDEGIATAVDTGIEGTFEGVTEGVTEAVEGLGEGATDAAVEDAIATGTETATEEAVAQVVPKTATQIVKDAVHSYLQFKICDTVFTKTGDFIKAKIAEGHKEAVQAAVNAISEAFKRQQCNFKKWNVTISECIKAGKLQEEVDTGVSKTKVIRLIADGVTEACHDFLDVMTPKIVAIGTAAKANDENNVEDNIKKAEDAFLKAFPAYRAVLQRFDDNKKNQSEWHIDWDLPNLDKDVANVKSSHL